MDESTKLSTGIKKGGESSTSRFSCSSLNLQNYPLQTKVVAIGALSALVFLVVVVLSLVVVFTSLEIFYAEDAPLYKTNNLIFLVGDGFGPAFLTFARQYTANITGQSLDQTVLPIDSMLVATARTYSSSNYITDSAAGATAYSCGSKTYNAAIGVLPPDGANGMPPTPQANKQPVPCGTMLEAANKLGMRTGVVVTSRVTHATPASFMTHMSFRDYEEEIATQIANGTFNLVFGGGRDMFEKRKDGQNLIQSMQDKGYQYISNYTQMQSADLKLPLLGLFAKSHMDYEIDRRNQVPQTQPSLSQMVARALELLSAPDPKTNKPAPPFFLMVEGSRIDMAAHDNDAGSAYLEIMQFQQSIELIKQFVDANPNTMVISTSDHSTGGLTVGAGFHNYTNALYTWIPPVLAVQNASATKIKDSIVGGMSIQDAMLTYAGIGDLDERELFDLENAFNTSTSKWQVKAIGDVIGARALIGWTTDGHTGVDVNVYAYGNYPKSKFQTGNMNNIDVGNIVIDSFQFRNSMNDISEELSWMTFPLNDPAKDGKRSVHDDGYCYGTHD